MKEQLKTLSKNLLTTRTKTTSYLLKRILVTNLLSLVILTITYLWIVYLLSNVNSFWDIFRGKDVYVEKDTVPPTKPYLNSVPEATKEDRIDISGRSEAGVKVILRIDGQKAQETISDTEGKFNFTGIAVGFASQVLYVEATDDAGNVSNPSQTFTIVKDIEEPEVEILTPKEDGETVKSTGRTYRVTGKTELGVTVQVNEQMAMLSTNGEFSASIRLEEGSNEIKIKVVDKAGNEKEEIRRVNYEKID
jgi:hypothetical protein